MFDVCVRSYFFLLQKKEWFHITHDFFSIFILCLNWKAIIHWIESMVQISIYMTGGGRTRERKRCPKKSSRTYNILNIFILFYLGCAEQMIFHKLLWIVLYRFIIQILCVYTFRSLHCTVHMHKTQSCYIREVLLYSWHKYFQLIPSHNVVYMIFARHIFFQ